MRCKFCYFEGVLVSPNTQSRLLKIIRPILQVAECRRCQTRHTLRGRLLWGPKIPVGPLVADMEEVIVPQTQAKATSSRPTKRPFSPASRTPTGRYRSRTI